MINFKFLQKYQQLQAGIMFNNVTKLDFANISYCDIDKTTLKVAENVWHKHNKTNKLEYFVAHKNNKPVAVSTLTNYNEIGYISNVGSLKEIRGEGYGKLATLYCVEQSKKNGNTKHCLATEEGTYPNEFYKKIGFKTRFTATGYSKIEK